MKKIGFCLLLLFLNFGCAKKTEEINWQVVQPIWQKIVDLNRDFKANVYADPKPTLKALYQQADGNIEELNQLKGQIQAMTLPSDWKMKFDQGLEANISYYKCCQLIIDKKARQGQSYDELRDCARDSLSFYRECLQIGWPELSRETFQIAAKIEGLIAGAQAKVSAPSQPAAKVIVVERPSQPRIERSFVTARGVGICPDSQVRHLSERDLIDRTAWELDIMRNEIYARHGRRFVKSKYIEYFNARSWYEINPHYSDNRLSAIERRNASFIFQYQRRTGLTTG